MNSYRIKFTPNITKVVSHEFMADYTRSLEDLLRNTYESEEYSIHVSYPTTDMVKKNEIRYTVHIYLKTDIILTSKDFFDKVNPMHPINIVNVKNCEYDKPITEETIGWINDGETTYSEGGTYYDPYYKLYINGPSDYEIVYIPYFIRNMTERDKARYRGHTYMWRCTGSWDNFLKATTLEKAIEEFEEWYYKKLWECVDNLQDRLHTATEKYRDFADYRRFKGDKI